MKKTYYGVKNNYVKLVILIILCIVLFLTIGYSAFSTELGINGFWAIVRIQKDVRIDGISLSSTSGNATSNYEEYDVKNVYSSISLPNNNSSVTYDVVIHNLGNVAMGILDISGLPSNLKYSISNYDLKEPLCDDESQSQCMLGTTTTLHLKIEYDENGYDENNTDYTLNLNFNFKRVFSITYRNITDYNYPKTIMEDETLNLSFTDDIPNGVNVTGVTSFSYSSPTITFSNPIDDVIISSVVYSKHYDRLEFDGTNYENTNIYLFNEENINKNFEISFELESVDANQISQATIINSMDENNNSYPGFVFRIQTNKTDMEFNSPKIKNRTGVKIANTNKVVIKRVNDIYYIQINDGKIETLGTYTGGTFDVPVVLGSSPDTNPPRYFKGTLTNINIEVTDPEYYTVKFNANGGTGTMPDQLIRKDETVALSENLFENEDYIFDGWNTMPDGTGTYYEDKTQITNLVSPDETITLYATWLQGMIYNVNYNANGGTGTMTMQEFEYGQTQNLKNNEFSKPNSIFMRWNTKPDGSGTNYQEGQSVKNLTKTPNDTVELYAIWMASSYTLSGDYVFTGSNYIDTGVYLFNEKTIDNDFEVSFEIVSRGTTTKQATLVSCMDESGSPWPGFVYRINTGTEDQFSANTNNSIKMEQNYQNQDITKVSIKRTNHILYLSFNDGTYEQVLDMTQLLKTFDVPLTFGSSLNAKGNPQRYFKGTLRNMSVTIIE